MKELKSPEETADWMLKHFSFPSDAIKACEVVINTPLLPKYDMDSIHCRHFYMEVKDILEAKNKTEFKQHNSEIFRSEY